MAPLRILVADDHAAVRRSLRSLLESRSDWALCGEATNGREAVEQTRRLKPDVVLLDMSMPEMNGLEATRQILKEAPETQILLLTMHHSEELAEEAFGAGAQAVLLKSGADEILTRAIDSLSRIETQIGGRGVGRSRHIGAFFQSTSERMEILAPFVAEGLRAGQKAIHIIDPPGRETHIRQLREAGVDVDRAISQRQMDLIPWDAMYLHNGRFDEQVVLDRLQGLLRARAVQGFVLGRLVAHMEWAVDDLPGVDDLAKYEAQVTGVLKGFRDLVVCAYDVTKFPAGTIMDVMRAHPAVVVGRTFHENPFYAPPAELLEELNGRLAGREA